MRTNHFLFIFLFFTQVVFGQSLCQKGTWIFGLNPVEYSFLNTNKWAGYNDDTITSGDTSKFTGIGFGFNIGAGYFVKDNFCIGAGFGIGSNLIPGVVPGSFSVPTSLFARYYLLQKKRCFSFTRQDNTRRYAFFIQGVINGGYAIYNSENSSTKKKETDYSYGGKIAVGYTYVLAKHVAFEIMGMYNNITRSAFITSSQNSVTLPSSKYIHNNSGFNLLLGVQGYF